VALGRPDEARRLVKEAVAGNPGLTVANFTFKERYRGLESAACCVSGSRRPACQRERGDGSATAVN
jgi:hypothetical protein